MRKNNYTNEIESLSIMLMGIIERLVQKKKEGGMINSYDFEAFNNYICAESAFKLSEITNSDTKDFKQILDLKRGFDEKNIEITADILLAISELATPPLNARLVEKALHMFRFLKKTSRKFSDKYVMKIENVEEILNSIKATSC